MCALRWSDIDLVTGSVLIYRALIDVGVGEKDTKTHAARRLRLDPATVEALTACRAATEERAAALASKVASSAQQGIGTDDEDPSIRPWSRRGPVPPGEVRWLSASRAWKHQRRPRTPTGR